MLRDFSDAAKQKLLNYVDEVTANGTMKQVEILQLWIQLTNRYE